MFSSPDDLFSYIESFIDPSKRNPPELRRLRKRRMEYLLSRCGNPEQGKEILHVAGSKGKGSVSAFLSAGLSFSGKRCGRFLSPHISDYRERITLDGHFFSDASYIYAGEQIRKAIEVLDDELFPKDQRPSSFELLCLCAFLIFHKEQCSHIVLETGIGGRLDATNFVDPVASIITPIELEHSDILGSSIQEIAYEKAGIIKAGKPLFTSAQQTEARRVLEQRAEEEKAGFFYLPDLYPEISGENREEGFKLCQPFPLQLSLFGDFQGENALLAHLCLKTLYGADLSSGFSKARLPGRMEKLMDAPPIFIDGAHTKSSVLRCSENILDVDSDPIIIFGSVEGKRSSAMAEVLGTRFRDIIISKPGEFKKSDLPALAREFRPYPCTLRIIEEQHEALRYALDLSDKRRAILILGSFYLVGAFRPLILKQSEMKG